jgi:hypothetical protein
LLAILAALTALIAWMSEILVGCIQPVARQLDMTDMFIGVIVVAMVGNSAEQSTAVLMARKDRMDLALSIAIGSSIQIALFVAPVLVFFGYLVAPAPINLVLTPAEVLAVAFSVVIAGQICGDGESNWFEGGAAPRRLRDCGAALILPARKLEAGEPGWESAPAPPCPASNPIRRPAPPGPLPARADRMLTWQADCERQLSTGRMQRLHTTGNLVCFSDASLPTAGSGMPSRFR